MNKILILLFSILALSLFFLNPFSISSSPIKATYVYESNPSNYGSSNYVYVIPFSGSSRNTLLSFSVDENLYEVDSATLTFDMAHYVPDAGESFDLMVYCLDDDFSWEQNVINWGGRPQSSLDYSTSQYSLLNIDSSLADTTINLDVTDLLNYCLPFNTDSQIDFYLIGSNGIALEDADYIRITKSTFDLTYDPFSCEDGIKNQNEINIDCGGVCSACVSESSSEESSLDSLTPNYQPSEDLDFVLDNELLSPKEKIMGLWQRIKNFFRGVL